MLTVPPYVVAAVVLCSCSYISDRIQSRGFFVAGASALAGIGYVLVLTVFDNEHVRYFAVFCITSGTYTTIGVVIAWCTSRPQRLWRILALMSVRCAYSRP